MLSDAVRVRRGYVACHPLVARRFNDVLIAPLRTQQGFDPICQEVRCWRCKDLKALSKAQNFFARLTEQPKTGVVKHVVGTFYLYLIVYVTGHIFHAD
ncbi:hypothetical protein BYT27DRAFT_7184522, partial [Phlegmacium glaucopus]